ncbi:GIY-YIG catalytic domain protein [compost metagenome]
MKWVAPACSAAYILTDIVSGMYYVGSTVNLRARLYSHYSKLEAGGHDNHNFQRCYSGWHNIHIEFIECNSLESARRTESSLLKFHCGDDLLCNIGTGASTWEFGMPEEYREHLRQTSRRYATRPEVLERWNRMNANRPRERVLEYARIARESRGPVSDETRQRMSDAWHRNGGISEETRRKMTEANARREIHFTPEARTRQRQACLRPVSIEGIHYQGVTEAANALGIGQTTVSYRLKSERFEKWIYLEN